MNSFGEWLIGTEISNPAANSVLVTSNAMDAGFYRLFGYITTTAAAPFLIQILDGEQVIKKSFRIQVAANTTFVIDIPTFFSLNLNDEIRITNPATILLSTVQASLVLCRLGN